MDQPVAFVLYLLAKAAVYMAWCGVGARLHGQGERILLKGIAFGALRLALGLVLGLVVILALVNWLSQATQSGVGLYLLVYVPVRWAEWSFVAVMMDRGNASLFNFLVGRTPRSQLWRAGGIALSCLADIPMILSLHGLPVGRFMC